MTLRPLTSALRHRTVRSVAAVLALGALVSGCARSCNKTSGPRAAKDDLALSPRETDIVFMANLARARGSAMWRKLIDARDKNPEAKKSYDDFTKKCLFDPLQQIDSIFVALPREVEQSREFAILLRGTFPDTSPVTCLRATAQENQRDVTETFYNGHKLYATSGNEGYLTVLDRHVTVLAGREWVKKVIDLSDERTKPPGDKGAREHKELVDLMKRARTADALWAAGLVPPGVSDRLSRQPELGPASTLKSLLAAIDFGKGLSAGLVLDLAGEPEAVELNRRVSEQLAGARKVPYVQAAGLVSYFDTIKTGARGNAFSVQIDLNQQQVDDLATRLSGLSKLIAGRGPGF